MLYVNEEYHFKFKLTGIEIIHESKALYRLCGQRVAYDSKRANKCPLFLLLSNFGKTTFTKFSTYYPVFDTFYKMVSLWSYLLVVFADKSRNELNSKGIIK